MLTILSPSIVLTNTDPSSEIFKKSKSRYYYYITSHEGMRQENLPKIANRLEVKTTNGSRVTPKTAGIESTLKKKNCVSQHSLGKLTRNSTKIEG